MDSDDEMESIDAGAKEASLSPAPERKRSLNRTPEPEENKRFKETSPSPEPSLVSSEELSSIPSQESSFESRLTTKEELQWKKEREELLFLNPDSSSFSQTQGFKMVSGYP